MAGPESHEGPFEAQGSRLLPGMRRVSPGDTRRCWDPAAASEFRAIWRLSATRARRASSNSLLTLRAVR